MGNDATDFTGLDAIVAHLSFGLFNNSLTLTQYYLNIYKRYTYQTDL